MGSDRDDELGRTATAPAGTRAPATPAPPLEATLGRYRIERELGAGGMGVVHAAFDPDLERRVALKVLRADGDGGEARQRLLREARAMARLAHPNVVTVHEVGSANGRDYVAMELVDGQTLADWLRAEPRPPEAILAAFVAAGRGLAAAHAAGIVHRDFKPHNVLRHPSGRIVVTDFGLARDAHELGPSDPLAVTLPVPGQGEVATGSSPLSGLTATGSVLGTPAYMAPEQWRGGAVTPATDQFAYCVALWEALAGARPFHGDTIEELRRHVERGPGELDASKLPRGLRAALVRGLDPDPKRRWPSMEALLAAMTPRRKAPVAAFVGSAGVVGAAIVYLLATRGGEPSAPAAASCPPPALDPATITVGDRPERAWIDADLAAWRAARRDACALDPAPRGPRLACLDAVAARLAQVARGIAALPAETPAVDAGGLAIAPSVCALPALPRLVLTTPAFGDVVAAVIREQANPAATREDVAQRMVERAGTDPCAAALAHRLAADAAAQPSARDRHLGEAEQQAERCADDRVRADVALAGAASALRSGFLGNAITAKVKLAAAAVERVSQPDLFAELDLLRSDLATRADNLDEAIARGEAAIAGYAARGRIVARVRAGLRTLDLRELRGAPEDRAAIERDQRDWRALVARELGADHPLVRRIDAEIAARRFLAGDVEGAVARLEQLRKPVPLAHARPLHGKVVDEHGRPVVGARVSAGAGIFGSSASAAVAWPPADGLRVASTGADGGFVIEDAPEDGIVIAQLGARRSGPKPIADGVTLALAPTARIAGKVELGGIPAHRVIISAQDARLPVTTRYEALAPVRPDGTFELDGVPRARVRVLAVLRIGASRSLAATTVDVRGPVVEGVRLSVPAQGRVVSVIVRSTVGAPVGNAQVLVFSGNQRSTTADKIQFAAAAGVTLARQLELEKAPADVVNTARTGDLFATLRDVPPGAASACAIGLPAELDDPTLDRKIRGNEDKIEVRCTPIAPGAKAVVVEVPPWPRLD